MGEQSTTSPIQGEGHEAKVMEGQGQQDWGSGFVPGLEDEASSGYEDSQDTKRH